MTSFWLWPSDPPFPDQWYLPLIVPAILVGLGLGLYFKGASMEAMGARAAYRLLGLPLCLVALAIGGAVLAHWLSDPVYRSVVVSGRVKVGQMGAPSIGLFGLLAIAVHRRVITNQGHRRK